MISAIKEINRVLTQGRTVFFTRDGTKKEKNHRSENILIMLIRRNYSCKNKEKNLFFTKEPTSSNSGHRK